MKETAPLKIILTGASRGLGLAMVREFVQRGHVVLGCSRQAAGVAALTHEFGPPHQFVQVDVADEASVRDWAQQALAGGPPDLLLNNAAVVNRLAPLWQQSADELQEIFAVNVLGVGHVVRHFVPAMIARGRGVIVNFSSGWGRSTSPEVAPYCATKYAVEGLTLALAQELPAGMAAVALNPGIIATDMLRSCFGDDAENYPAPDAWARKAAPFLLQLSAKDNGRSLDVPR